MEISELGEFGLIDRLTDGLKNVNDSTVKGVGDDCAILRYPAGKEILVTTDLLLENVHFDLTYVPLKHLGYKSAIVNFSDIYAMNGRPRQITVSLGISRRFAVAVRAPFRAADQGHGPTLFRANPPDKKEPGLGELPPVRHCPGDGKGGGAWVYVRGPGGPQIRPAGAEKAERH